MKLNNYWNYLNFSLLEDVIKTFCREALMARMEEYKKKLEDFRCKTRLCVFAETEQKCLLAGENLKEFVVKHDKNWTMCTLQDLENWKKSLTKTLLLPPFALKPRKISTGCVSITWAIPTMFTTSVAEKLKTLDMTDFCSEHKIMSLIFNGMEYFGASATENPDTSSNTHLHKETGQLYISAIIMTAHNYHMTQSCRLMQLFYGLA